MAVLMIDLDHFKCINESFGHTLGDQILKGLVQTIKNEIRGSDIVFRYGGEEFVVLLTNTQQATAMEIADRLRLSVNAMQVEREGEQVNASVSIGVSMLHPDDSVKRILERASFAMFNAKSEGRDQVKVCYEQAVARL
jgi:diguanylate cyclase (GGDEF)-like protein